MGYIFFLQDLENFLQGFIRKKLSLCERDENHFTVIIILSRSWRKFIIRHSYVSRLEGESSRRGARSVLQLSGEVKKVNLCKNAQRWKVYVMLHCIVGLIWLVQYISGSKLLPFQLLQIIHKPHIWWCSNYSYALHPLLRDLLKFLVFMLERVKKTIPPPTTIRCMPLILSCYS